MNEKLSQHDFELLSAWHDGELNQAEHQAVSHLIETNQTWKAAANELVSLDDLLGNLTVPSAAQDLSERIKLQVANRNKSVILKLTRWLAPIAAAAAITIACVSYMFGTADNSSAPTAGGEVVATASSDIPDKILETDTKLFTGIAAANTGSLRNRITALTGHSSVAETIGKGDQKWASMSNTQRSALKQSALAIMEQSPADLKALIEKYSKNNPAQKDNWIAQVVKSLTEKQKADLRKAKPAERIKFYLKQRDLLIKQGKIKVGK